MLVGRVPFLTVTEFIRAKIKAWSMYVLSIDHHIERCLTATRRRALERDAQDITFAMSRYWNRVDINQIPEQEMNDFASRFPAVAPSWQDLKRKYGVCVSLNSL